MYYLRIGTRLNLKKPKLFGEKLQWLKLYNRKSDYTIMVDKVKAKEYVSEIIGKEYIIPTLGVWKRVEDIDFNVLPNQFVIKCNHNSGTGMYICKDKAKMDVNAVKKELSKGLKENYYLHGREWPYKHVPRRIFAEAYISDESIGLDAIAEKKAAMRGNLRDYKFYCFNGEPKLIQIISNRATDECIDFFDVAWNRIDGLTGLSEGVHTSTATIEPPKSLKDMLKCAKMLAKDIPFSRIDFYDINGKAYWGEITFYPTSGFGKFKPDSWNRITGDWIKLPVDN